MLVAVFGVVLLIFLFLDWIKVFTRSKLPPGPFGIPLLGYLPFLNPKTLPQTFTMLGRKYGDIFSLKIGTRTVVILNSKRAIKAGFSKMELCGRPVSKLIFFVENRGVVAGNGQQWKERRHFASNQMRSLGMYGTENEEYLRILISTLIEKIGDQADMSKPVNIGTDVRTATICWIWNSFIGEQVTLDDPLFPAVIDSFDSFLAGRMVIAAGFALFCPELVKVIPNCLILPESNKVEYYNLIRYAELIVANRKHRLIRGEDSCDFISNYFKEIHKNKDGPNINLDEGDIVIDLVQIMFAAMETVGTTLIWTVYLMSYYPEMQKRMQQEIDTHIGKKKITYQDKISCPYTESVIAEVQRFVSVTPLGVPHEASKNTKLGEYIVPKGSIVFANIYACHRDPVYWKNPDEFNPDRFLDENNNFISNHEGFLPYSAGRRNCFGETLARIQLFIFVVSLFRHFTFRLPEHLSKSKPRLQACSTTTNACHQHEYIVEKRNLEF